MTNSLLSITSNSTYTGFTIRVKTTHNPSIISSGEYMFNYVNYVKATNGTTIAYRALNIIIYKCVTECATCGSYNQSATPPWGICTACSPGYIVSNGDCVISLCGDSKVNAGEFCDDGDTSGADKCSADCLSNVVGWSCTGGDTSNPSTCNPVCGDLRVVGTEFCDDGD